MFNLTGSEIAFLVLIGLIVLGPEKLPDAVRKFTKAYNEFKKMATGFQTEVKDAFEEPMRELRGTADAMRKAAGEIDIGFDLDGSKAGKVTTGKPAEPIRRDTGGLNFGNTNAKRQERAARDTANPEATDTETPAAAETPTAAEADE
ncbi:hypothetical protein BH10ACT2_BH10ACT2_11590 [soil metagenome]